MWSSTKRRVLGVAAVSAALAAVTIFNAQVVRTGPAADPLLIASAACALVALGGTASEWPQSRAFLLPITLAISATSIVATMLHPPVQAEQDAFWIVLEFMSVSALMVVVTRSAPSRLAFVGGSALMLAAALQMLRVSPRTLSLELLGALITWTSGAGLAAALGVYLRSLDTRRARLVDHARRTQRLALARDLHDFVAHDVTGMVVQAQAAHVVSRSDPDAAIAALPRIERAGLRALGSLDRTVHTLHELGSPDEARGTSEESTAYGEHRRREFDLDDLLSLVARFAATDSCAINITLADSALPPHVLNHAYRVTLEALTNVRRHAPAGAAVRITIEQSAEALAVVVINEYSAESAPRLDRSVLGVERPGYGLNALREAVTSTGGMLHAGARNNGVEWEIRALIPLHSQELA